jgi:hypothetical protein
MFNKSIISISVSLVFYVLNITGAHASGEQYWKVYNDLLKGIQDRGALLNTAQVPLTDKRTGLQDVLDGNGNVIAKIVYAYEKVKGNSVTQVDLNTLRGAIIALSSSFIDNDTADFSQYSGEVVSDPLGDPSYVNIDYSKLFFNIKINEGNGFTKVPGKYTSMGKTVYLNNFSDVPLLWVHFSEMATVLNKMKWKTKKPIYEVRFLTASTSFVYSYENLNLAQATAQLSVVSTQTIDRIVSPPLKLEACSFQNDWSISRDPRYGGLGYYKYKYSFNNTELYLKDIKGYYQNYNNIWYCHNTFEAEYSRNYYWIEKIIDPTGEYEIEGSKPTIFFPDVHGGGYNDTLYYDRNRIYIFRYDFPAVSITDPGLGRDSSGNDVVMAGCMVCRFGESFHTTFSRNGMTVELPLGISSGWQSGMKVFSYLTTQQFPDFAITHHSLNTYIAGTSGNTEPDDNKWKFTIIQRPKGAEVPMYWRWDNDTPVDAVPINGNSYVLTEQPGEFKVEFSDGVTHFFGANGSLGRCRQVEDDEVLEVSMSGLGDENLVISGGVAYPTQVVSTLGKAVVAYSDNVCTSIEYFIFYLMEYVPLGKFQISTPSSSAGE